MENKKRPAKKAFADINLCVSCGCCVKACPKNAISVFKGAYAVVNSDLCVGCSICKKACPASVIEIKEVWT